MGSVSALRSAATATGLVAFGALLFGDVVNGTLRDGHVPSTIAWYLVAFVAFGLAVVAAERTYRQSGSVPWAWLWLVPIGFRVLLWFTEPTLSDDVYRYLWDGHLLTSGVNPYAHTVDAAALDPHQIPLRASVNNPSLATPYLPTMQAIFGLVDLIAPRAATSMQVVMTGFDLLTAWLLTLLLGRAGLPAHRVVLYLWNPLVIVEIAHGAHIDAAMVALLATGLVLAAPVASASVRRRGPGGPESIRGLTLLAGPVVMAAATLTRGLPVLAVAVLWWRWDGRQRVAFVVAGVLGVLAFVPEAGLGLFGPLTGTGVFGTIRAYGEQWQFNASIYNGVASVVAGSGDGRPARLVVAVAMAAIVALVAVKARGRAQANRPEPERLQADLRAVGWLMVGYVLLTPTLHPWYLVVVMAMLPFATPTDGEQGLVRWFGLAPWLYLAAAVSLSYLTYLDPDAHAELAWVRRVEWWPTIGLAVAAATIRLRLGGPRPSTATTIDGDGPLAARPPVVSGDE